MRIITLMRKLHLNTLYTIAEVLLPHNEEMRKEIVKGRHTNINGQISGQFHISPL